MRERGEASTTETFDRARGKIFEKLLANGEEEEVVIEYSGE